VCTNDRRKSGARCWFCMRGEGRQNLRRKVSVAAAGPRRVFKATGEGKGQGASSSGGGGDFKVWEDCLAKGKTTQNTGTERL